MAPATHIQHRHLGEWPAGFITMVLMGWGGLLPLMFAAVMDVPHRLVATAEHHSLLAESRGRRGVCHNSMYTDHVIVLLKPDPQDCNIVLRLLVFFSSVTGLHMKS